MYPCIKSTHLVTKSPCHEKSCHEMSRHEKSVFRKEYPSCHEKSCHEKSLSRRVLYRKVPVTKSLYPIYDTYDDDIVKNSSFYNFGKSRFKNIYQCIEIILQKKCWLISHYINTQTIITMKLSGVERNFQRDK